MNYLGSKKDLIENMRFDKNGIIEIANPMSENYSIVRSSVLPSLFMAERESGTAVYPHKIFEYGKVAYAQPEKNTGTETADCLGFLQVSEGSNYNEAASVVSSLLYFLNIDYKVIEGDKPFYITGRQASILVDGKEVGHFGEVHPAVLENWEIQNPAIACEINFSKIVK